MENSRDTGYTSTDMKKRRKSPTGVKKIKATSKRPYPDNDPEWDNLEMRYSQMDSDAMRQLAEILEESS